MRNFSGTRKTQICVWRFGCIHTVRKTILRAHRKRVPNGVLYPPCRAQVRFGMWTQHARRFIHNTWRTWRLHAAVWKHSMMIKTDAASLVSTVKSRLGIENRPAATFLLQTLCQLPRFPGPGSCGCRAQALLPAAWGLSQGGEIPNKADKLNVGGQSYTQAYRGSSCRLDLTAVRSRQGSPCVARNGRRKQSSAKFAPVRTQSSRFLVVQCCGAASTCRSGSRESGKPGQRPPAKLPCPALQLHAPSHPR